MTKIEKYNKAFCDTFQLTEDKLQNLQYQGVELWDSVGHMSLIAALEEAFDIMLYPEDIMDLTSYGKGKEILAKYDVTL